MLLISGYNHAFLEQIVKENEKRWGNGGKMCIERLTESILNFRRTNETQSRRGLFHH